MKPKTPDWAGQIIARRQPPGGRRFCALLAAGAALFPCGCKQTPPPAAEAPVVQVAAIVATNAPASVEFIGQLDSPQNVEVRARVEAFVDKMLFTEGTEVKEGDPLFKLDDKPFKERLDAGERVAGRGESGAEQIPRRTSRA